MPEISLGLKPDRKDLEGIIRRFHYSDRDQDELLQLYRSIDPLIDCRISYKIHDTKQDNSKAEDYAVAIVTLGKGLDDLIEEFLSKEMVSKAAMADSIGLMLLTKAYEKLVELICTETCREVKELRFPGDGFDISRVEDIYNELKPERVTLLDSGMLAPLKSVCLILPLGAPDLPDGKKKACDICSNCSAKDCSMRKKEEVDEPVKAHPYGYTKIFGENKRG